jgi:hypothetical protein
MRNIASLKNASTVILAAQIIDSCQNNQGDNNNGKEHTKA